MMRTQHFFQRIALMTAYFIFAAHTSVSAQEALVGSPVKRFALTPNAAEVIPTPFAVTRADKNFRVAIKRWAADAGWEFEPEHWALPRDIPLAGKGEFGTDFREAVRELLKSSELADQPAQPCFYSNKVLRVVPINELCARTSSN